MRAVKCSFEACRTKNVGEGAHSLLGVVAPAAAVAVATEVSLESVAPSSSSLPSQLLLPSFGELKAVVAQLSAQFENEFRGERSISASRSCSRRGPIEFRRSLSPLPMLGVCVCVDVCVSLTVYSVSVYVRILLHCLFTYITFGVLIGQQLQLCVGSRLVNISFGVFFLLFFFVLFFLCFPKKNQKSKLHSKGARVCLCVCLSVCVLSCM